MFTKTLVFLFAVTLALVVVILLLPVKFLKDTNPIRIHTKRMCLAFFKWVKPLEAELDAYYK